MARGAEEQHALDERLWSAAEGGNAAAVVRLAAEGASANAEGGDLGEPAVVAATGRCRRPDEKQRGGPPNQGAKTGSQNGHILAAGWPYTPLDRYAPRGRFMTPS